MARRIVPSRGFDGHNIVDPEFKLGKILEKEVVKQAWVFSWGERDDGRLYN
ncbi:MAG TPA: hypothetical protein PLY09_00795 [Methanothrix sp.]|nr:hypothetical protein [Methanothrix sp.]HPJ83281.1 hypothetical protein [Methanothrix sp.]